MFSDPVVGEHFFGRQEIIEVLTKRANALKSGYRQNIAIIGHQQLGKSSILRHFLQSYRDPSVLAIYVEIKLQSLDYFVDQFVRSLLFQYLRQSQSLVSPTESLEKLIEAASSKLPKTVARIREISQLLKTRHADDAYNKLFELTSVVKAETGLNCIVILDEFHRLGEFGIKNAFSDFGKRIMVQKDTMYLLASSAFSASRKILAEKLALLFGNFERIYLDNFDFETSYRFVEKKLEPLTVAPELKNFLVSFTDGHPFFLETIVSRLRELTLSTQKNEVSAAEVAEVFYRLFYESQGVLNQYFMKLISPWTQSRSRGKHVLILTQVARGCGKLKDIASWLNLSQKEVATQVQELMEYEILVKTGVFHRFHNKIFKFWLREVYEKKELSLLGAEGKKDAFVEGVLEMVREHGEILAMDLGERVKGLFREFRNDLVEFGEKKRQLPHFTDVVFDAGEAADGSTRKIIARGQGRCWVCKVVEERATEREVLELVKTEPQEEKEPHTKVLLALSGLDDTAKLLAKEKKIFTLSLSRVNLLMDLYGQAPIVRT